MLVHPLPVVDTEINDQSNTSLSVKSAMRQLRTELERHGKDLRLYGDNNGGMLERKRDQVADDKKRILIGSSSSPLEALLCPSLIGWANQQGGSG